jgi:hypothetical protein
MAQDSRQAHVHFIGGGHIAVSAEDGQRVEHEIEAEKMRVVPVTLASNGTRAVVRVAAVSYVHYPEPVRLAPPMSSHSYPST